MKNIKIEDIQKLLFTIFVNFQLLWIVFIIKNKGKWLYQVATMNKFTLRVILLAEWLLKKGFLFPQK